MYSIDRIRWLGSISFFFFAHSLAAQFVAFNDHAPGVGTHSNTTTWSCLVVPTGGLLKNIATGSNTAASLNITRTGTGAATGGSAAGYPQIGTPAQITFTNYVDFIGSPGAAVQISNVVLHYTFSGLSTAKRYNFKGSAVRAGVGSNYTNRWTKVSILGATSFTSQHTANVIASSQQPTLAANEAAVNFGVNLTGDMLVWDEITPSPGGTFEITCEFYQGPLPAPLSSTLNAPPYGYGITAIRLEEFSSVVQPIVIQSGPTPSSTNILQGETASFSINVAGTNPRYRWFRTDGQAVAHATTVNAPILTITNAQPSDGLPTTYRVEVTNAVSTNISGGAVLSVQQDTVPPVLVSALAYVNGSNFLAAFSEPLDPSRLVPTSFHIRLIGEQTDLPVSSVFVTNETNVFISTVGTRTAFGNYNLSIDANGVFDANGNAYPGGSVPFLMEVALLGFNNSPWNYNAEGVDLGLAFNASEYDDHTWSNGLSVFDVLRPQPPGRSTVAGFPVATQLPLTNALYPVTTGVIPTYYFRTHFRLPTALVHVLGLKLRTLVDDFDTFYLNGKDAYRNAAYPAAFAPGFGYAGGTAVATAAIAGPFTIGISNLLDGDNVAAVIINQVNGGSSDSTFAYELVATVDHLDSPASITVARDPDTGLVTLTWPTGTGARLYQSAYLSDSPSDWSLVSNAADGSHTFNPALPGPTEKFFTLRR